MKTIFAIDPGNLFSAYCIMTEDYKIIEAAKKRITKYCPFLPTMHSMMTFRS